MATKEEILAKFDEQVRESRELLEFQLTRIEEAGIEIKEASLEGITHSFVFPYNISDDAYEYLRDVLEDPDEEINYYFEGQNALFFTTNLISQM